MRRCCPVDFAVPDVFAWRRAGGGAARDRWVAGLAADRDLSVRRLVIGEVPERLKGLVSKTSVRVSVPGVRIPPSPVFPEICGHSPNGTLAAATPFLRRHGTAVPLPDALKEALPDSLRSARS